MDPNSQMNVWLSTGNDHVWDIGETRPATPWEAEIDRLMEKQLSTLKPQARKVLYDRVQEIALCHSTGSVSYCYASRLVRNCFSMSSLLPSSTCIVTCASRPFVSFTGAWPTSATSSDGSSLMP